MQLKNLETANFRITAAGSAFNVKAITPMARAYCRLKKLQTVEIFSYRAVSEGETIEALLGHIADLEAGVAKLAAI